MAQEFDGPVEIKGQLRIEGSNLHDVMLMVNVGVSQFFGSVTVSNNLDTTGLLSCGGLTTGGNIVTHGDLEIGTIVANRADHIVTLEGGLATTVDLVVRGSAAVNHDLEVGGNVNVKGDISLINGDCAEDFTIASNFSIDAGTVVVLGPDGALSPSEMPYDKRVVGVISGAGDYKPAIVLDRKPSPENRQPVALIGKAFCNVDASYGAIEIGDLLTSSNPGHAMKADDPFGRLDR